MKKLILYGFVFILLAVSVLSAQIQVNSLEQEGYSISYPTLSYFKLNQNQTFYFHVYNQSNGVLITGEDTSCLFHLYNTDGYLLKDTNLTFDGTDFSSFANEDNFSKLGKISYIISCNSSSLGGFVSASLNINPSGVEPTIENSLTYLGLLFLVLALLIIFLMIALNIDPTNEYDVGGKLLQVNFNKYIRIGLYFLAYNMFIVSLYLSWQISYQFLTLSFMAGMFKTLFYIALIVDIPLFLLVVIFTFIKLMLDSELTKFARIGLKPPRK